MAENIFDHHDAVVDQHAEHHDKREEHDHVERHAHIAQDDEPHGHGKGDRRGDEHRIAGAQEEAQDQKHEQDAHEQMVLELIHHLSDVFRHIIGDLVVRACGPAGLFLGKDFFGLVDDPHDVFARSFCYGQGERRFAVDARNRLTVARIGKGDLRHVPDADILSFSDRTTRSLNWSGSVSSPVTLIEKRKPEAISVPPGMFVCCVEIAFEISARVSPY